MHLPLGFVFFMVSGGLCAIGSICNIQDDRKGETKLHTGTCQEKGACMKSGLAAVLKSSNDQKACPDDDETIQCCIDISCGSGSDGPHRCRSNTEDNPCETGSYKAGVRNHLYCPFSASDAKLECCISTPKLELKTRDIFNNPFRVSYGMPTSNTQFNNLNPGGISTSNTPTSNLNLGAYNRNPIDIHGSGQQGGGSVSVKGNWVPAAISAVQGNFNINSLSPSIEWKSPTNFGSGSLNEGPMPIATENTPTPISSTPTSFDDYDNFDFSDESFD